MKRRLLIFGLLALLAVAAVTMWHYRARLFPHRETSEIFLRYHGAPGIQADFVKNFHINDTITVDVTVLQATDSTGWNTLLKDFCKTNVTIDTTGITPTTTSFFSLFPKGHPELLPDSDICANTLLVWSYSLQEMMVVNIEREDLLIPIMKYKFYNNKEKEKNKQSQTTHKL